MFVPAARGLHLFIGLPLILAAFFSVLWVKGFGPEDRELFRMNKADVKELREAEARGQIARRYRVERRRGGDSRNDRMTDQLELTRSENRDELQTSIPPLESRASPTLQYDRRSPCRRVGGASGVPDWRRTAFEERAAVIRKAAEILRARRTSLPG